MRKRKPQKNEARAWEEMSESGYMWPKPRRITVYIFDAQLNILKKIARESGLRLRHVMFQAFQSYIGAHSQENENRDNAKRS